MSDQFVKSIRNERDIRQLVQILRDLLPLNDNDLAVFIEADKSDKLNFPEPPWDNNREADIL